MGKDLKSIILAAGEGKRLRPLTNNMPKCMVEIFGKSLLERQIQEVDSYLIFTNEKAIINIVYYFESDF